MTEYLIGGYGADFGGTAVGIVRARTAADGRLEPAGLVAAVPSPSWLVRDGDHVHAALEGASAIASFGPRDGFPTCLRATVPSGVDAAPCHLAVARRGDGSKALVVSRYVDGVVAVHPLAPAVGAALVELTAEGRGPLEAQASPHAHHALVLDDGRVLTADLGADRVWLHRWAGAALERTSGVALPPGTGPRDLLALDDGRIAVLGEWSCSIVLLAPNATGFEVSGELALPGAAPGSQAAGLAVSTDGTYLIAGVRGADRIAIVRLTNSPDAPLAPVGSLASGGRGPRHLVVDDDRVHVANQLSNSIASFRLDAEGGLTPLAEPVAFASPSCLLALD